MYQEPRMCIFPAMGYWSVRGKPVSGSVANDALSITRGSHKPIFNKDYFQTVWVPRVRIVRWWMRKISLRIVWHTIDHSVCCLGQTTADPNEKCAIALIFAGVILQAIFLSLVLL